LTRNFFFLFFVFVLFNLTKNLCWRTSFFEKKLFFNFFAKFLLLRKIKFWKFISPLWGEPLSDKRRSRAGDPRCIELAHPTGLF